MNSQRAKDGWKSNEARSPLAKRLGVASSRKISDDDPLRKRSLLIVSSSDQFTQSLKTVLPNARFDSTVGADSVAEAKRKLNDREFDVVLVNAPLIDEFGVDFACGATSEGALCALLFVKADRFGEVCATAAPRGVFVLAKPTQGAVVLQALDFLCGIGDRLRRMEEKSASFEEKIQEIRIVNRAKLLLVEQLKMTEAEAHRFIEKQAMDRCVAKRAVAEGIIATRQGDRGFDK